MGTETEHEPGPDDGEPGRSRERLVSIECAHCGTEIAYRGTGRRPRYCSPTCRTRAWEQRRAAEHLGRDQPGPTVVREVVERTTEVDRPVPTPVAPTRGADWAALLDTLRTRLREQPHSVLRHPDDVDELAGALREAYAALTGHDLAASPATPTAGQQHLATAIERTVEDALGTPTPEPQRLSRQQRRALERQQRKRH